MRHDVSAESLEQFVAERGQRLLKVAVLLTGTREAGEDLLQAALERLLRHWRRIDGDPEGYLRRMLYNLAADGWRRQGLWHVKRVMLVPPPAARTPQTRWTSVTPLSACCGSFRTGSAL